MKTNDSTTTDSGNDANRVLCGVFVQWNSIVSGLKNRGICQCDHPAKYIVTYKEGTRGKIVTQNMCGKHYTHRKKASEKAKLRGWDDLFQSVPLNAT